MRNEHLPPTLPPTLTPFTQEYVWCGQDEPATRPPHAGRVYQLGDKAGLYTGIVLGSGSVVRAEVPVGSGIMRQFRVGAMSDGGVISVQPTDKDLIRRGYCAEAGSVCVGTEYRVTRLSVYHWAPR